MVQMRNWRILLDLDRASPALSYRDILGGLSRAIRDGRLPPGAPLPGTREMALMLGVNRKTVIVAYEEAVIKGWLVSRQRSGTFVSDAFDAGAAPPVARRAGQRSFLPPFRSPSLPAYFDGLPPHGRIQDGRMMYFDNGAPDHRLLPQAVLHRHYRNAMRDSLRSGGVRYGNLEAEQQLRAALAGMLGATRALAVSPDCICVTQGTQMALHLAAAALIRPGDTVVMERLSYPPAWAIFRALGARVEVVDIDADGCVVQQVEDLCRRMPIRFIYLTPHHQFPSTVSLRADRREKLLALAAQHAFSIIEEDYDHEYHFAGRPYPPLASGPRQRSVIYVGSLSKLLGSSFRCGFVVAPPNLIGALEKNQRLLTSHGDAVMQKMLAALIAGGELQRHVRRSSKHYRARQEVLLGCLHRSFGALAATRPPEGGLALWVTFGEEVDVDAMARHAVDESLFVRSGSQFSPTGESINGLRLGFASMSADELARAVARLHRAWLRSRE
ncbi:PLP-dependent aminotransferase family protein [Herbaspirillum sp. WKF16]|uniref:aminotransferase-like domain-containing protein n=1 Tax=Herbaspirillum sp. WKF16 TaxID=3028312 RepID=UPI0023A9DE45|nr:PLP-dependent aminotransferase family protein [Herbaspirillum sp. WKF16]WDZ96028.1 PLP-dependent aminotransferase family protein [Herbaspirillum sp. WKF16]